MTVFGLIWSMVLPPVVRVLPPVVSFRLHRSCVFARGRIDSSIMYLKWFRERKKLTMVKAQVYWKATKSKKSQMLDDFCESTGYCRRYAARVLHEAGGRYLLGETILVADPTKHIHRYRASRYGPAVQQALITIWSASTFLGPVRLAGGMPLFVENLTRHGHLSIDEETRQLLLQMSPA